MDQGNKDNKSSKKPSKEEMLDNMNKLTELSYARSGYGSAMTTMSSLEIAKLTGKRHDNVMRDITKMLKNLDISELTYESSYISKQNKELPCYKLDWDLTLTLVTGYSDRLRNIVVMRWNELERQASQTAPTRPAGPPTKLELAMENARLSEEVVELIRSEEKLKKENTGLRIENTELMIDNSILTHTVESQAIALDESKAWSTIKRQEKATGGKYDWRELKKWHKANGVARKEVFDQNYTSVKSYCAQAWLEVYDVEL